MKRVLVFAAYYYPHIGGYETSVHELGKRLVQLGYEIDVVTCTTEKAPAEEIRDGVCIYRLPAWNILGGTYPVPKPTPVTFRVLRRLSRQKYDLVSTQTRFFSTSLLGFIFARIRKLPLAHTEHGTRHSVTPNKLVEFVGKTYDHTFGSVIVKAALRNIGVSQAACDFTRHLGAKDPVVVHNGIDTGFFKKTASELKSQMGLSGVTMITFVGRLIYAKGVHDLITAFGQMQAKVPNAKLLIVGGGPYMAQLKSLAIEVGCGDDILFLGQKGQAEVIDILSASDIFVNPSYSEGLPTSVMEAASVGLPVVATDVGGTREIVESGVTGILVQPGQPSQITEALSLLTRNSQLASDLGMTARSLMRHKFDWAKITEQWVAHVIPGP